MNCDYPCNTSGSPHPISESWKHPICKWHRINLINRDHVFIAIFSYKIIELCEMKKWRCIGIHKSAVNLPCDTQVKNTSQPNVELIHDASHPSSSNSTTRFKTLSNIRGGDIRLRTSLLPSCWRLLLVSMEGYASWCSCAPHERVAGKCHCFSVRRAGAAATSAIRSGGGRNGRLVIEE